MLELFINSRLYFIREKYSIIEACQFIGIKILRFCYHESLSIAGNCRMCLVETDKSLKPITACSSPVINGMSIKTSGPLVLKARENILELLLLNHPLDCPICDQAGECDLQDQVIFFGNTTTRNYFNKFTVEDKYCGPLIKTIMTRCIQCTRCVRFGVELCGNKFLGVLNRGGSVEIGNYISTITTSELSANVVDLCPVGALTLKPVAFSYRPWELKSMESLDLMDSLGSNIYINFKESEIIRILPKKNTNLNSLWISNKGRFVYNLFSKNFFINNSQPQFSLSSFTKLFGKKLLFLVSPYLDFQTLNFLKHLMFISKGQIRIKINGFNKFFSNLYYFGGKNRLFNFFNLSVVSCFLISVNLQLESSILAARLRIKQLSGELFFFQFSTYSKLTSLTFFYRLHNFELLSFFFFKRFFYLPFLNSTILLFYGKAFASRIDYMFLDLFRLKYSNLILYTINSAANSEALKFLNYSFLAVNDLKYMHFIFAVLLDDTLLLRKYLFLIKKKTFWVNQFAEDIVNFLPKNNYISTTFFNTTGIYVNMEQRPQQFTFFKLSTKFHFINSFLFALFPIFTTSFFKSASNTRFILLAYLEEFLKFPHLFENQYNSVFKLYFFAEYTKYTLKYTLYPFKLVIEDTYRTNVFVKNSSILTKCSQEFRKLETNF